MRKLVHLLFMFTILIAPSLVFSETYVLKDGTEIEGNVLRMTGASISLKTGSGISSHDLSEFDSATVERYFSRQKERLDALETARQIEVEKRREIQDSSQPLNKKASSAVSDFVEDAGGMEQVLGWTALFGVIVLLIASIWLVIKAFCVSLPWGLLVLLTNGIGGLIFTIVNWQEAKSAFYLYILGLFLWASPAIYGIIQGL